jgi:hypothetical protein
MSWVNDLASLAGIPASAATLAVSMYGGCSAAERAAQPDALKDIGRILKDPSWSQSVQPSSIMQNVFGWTFGEKQLGWKCVRRSATATALFAISGCLLFNDAVRDFVFHINVNWSDARNLDVNHVWLIAGVVVGALAVAFFTALLPDYVALWKTRYLISMLKRKQLSLVVAPVLDMALSLVIGYLCGSLVWALVIICYSATGMTIDVSGNNVIVSFNVQGSFVELLGQSSSFENWHGILAINFQNMAHVLMGHIDSLRGVLLLSTLFTSIWTILILVSTAVLKILVPVEQLTSWFFDVDNHPVQAIGIVSGALVMLGAGLWSLVRWLV